MIKLDNYERAIEIYSQCPCDLKDAVRLLDGGLSSEETVRVLKRKKRKQRARDRNEILTQIGDGMIKEMTSGWDSIKSEQRRYRVSCLSRWGTDLHVELLESAHRMLLIWHLLIPMLFLISFIPLIKPLSALLGPYQNLLVALGVLIAIDVVIWAFRIDRLCDDELVHTMWMPMWAFGRWTRWAGKRLLIKDEDIDQRIKNCVLMHHEFRDGSGYPLHLKGDKIDTVVSIVTVSNIYDEMTSRRTSGSIPVR